MISISLTNPDSNSDPGQSSDSKALCIFFSFIVNWRWLLKICSMQSYIIFIIRDIKRFVYISCFFNCRAHCPKHLILLPLPSTYHQCMGPECFIFIVPDFRNRGYPCCITYTNLFVSWTGFRSLSISEPTKERIKHFVINNENEIHFIVYAQNMKHNLKKRNILVI